ITTSIEFPPIDPPQNTLETTTFIPKTNTTCLKLLPSCRNQPPTPKPPPLANPKNQHPESRNYLHQLGISFNLLEKLKYGTSFSPDFEKVFEWKDHLSLFVNSEEDALAHWPLPCRDEALEYLRSTENVIRKLCNILMKGLNVHEIDEQKESLLMGCKRMNLTFYPKCPNPELTFGTGPHSDASTITILLQDDVGGLYVRRFDDESWIHVPSINGALVVNVGDVLQILSNGKYKSAEHLVIPNGNKSRVSVPIFVHPTSDDVIGPLQEITDRGEKPIYKDVLFSDYIGHFFSKPHDGKATMEFAKF
ncbi:feruloyl CoA ortho-hydroxylase 2-like, partial [Chenopodium quinoa]|uniref:feruloyl CoA ortho-hydroxylase 2-like n=1 Tax=Chenopodium quinoa TaxID=63459 RepID=UPI000B787C25